jgi:SAM-dependent methyltransferase
LPIFAPPGLHEFVEVQAKKWFRSGGDVLDLGAGSGALALRLRDAGLHVVTADGMSTKLSALGFRCHQVDFNERFAKIIGAQFDGLVAVELIEHLENPWQSLREISSLLKPSGRAIVTTPNINSVTSKARFVRFGCFDWFTPQDRAALGHISPISPPILIEAAEKAGLKVLHIGGFGPLDFGIAAWPSQRALAGLVRMITQNSGDPKESTLFAVLERPE